MTSAVRVADALLGMAAGAEALRHASLALNSRPNVCLSADFGYRAALAPITLLALAIGVPDHEPPPAPSAPHRKARVRRARLPKKPRVRASKAKELDEFVEASSAWDPDSYTQLYTDQQAEAGSCRALLLEVIRRASFDWVLYRSSSKLAARQLAESAYHWLFVEDETTKQWQMRDRNGKGMLSFLAICDTMDLDPENVRRRVRTLTSKDIMGAGRPAEHRKKAKNSDEAVSDDAHSVYDVDVDSLPTYDPMFVSDG